MPVVLHTYLLARPSAEESDEEGGRDSQHQVTYRSFTVTEPSRARLTNLLNYPCVKALTLGNEILRRPLCKGVGIYPTSFRYLSRDSAIANRQPNSNFIPPLKRPE